MARGNALAWVLCATVIGGCSSIPGLDRWFGPDDPAKRYEKMAREQRETAEFEASQRRLPTYGEHMASGDRSRNKGELSQALWYYMSAHTLDPNADSPRARIAFVQLGRDALISEELFQELIRDGVESAGLWGGLALAQRAQGKRLEARQSAERARSLDSVAPVLILIEGAILDDLSEFDAAQALYAEALEANPDDASLLNNLGVSYLLEGSWDDAVATFEHALTRRPRDATLHNNVGIALGRLERYDEAHAHFRRAGGEGAALNNLGYVYYLNGRYEDAMSSYEQALDMEGIDKLRVLRNLEAAHEEQLALDPNLLLDASEDAPDAGQGALDSSAESSVQDGPDQK